MERKSRKRILAVTIPILIVAVVGIAGTTLAMLKTKTGAVQNKFAGAGVNIAVVEDGVTSLENEPNNTKDYAVITSSGVAKEVKILNKDSEAYPTTDTYVRVRLVPIFRDETGATVPMKTGWTADLKYTFGNDDGNWMYADVDGERYFYYKEALAPNAMTSALITKVSYAGKVPEGANFELQVLTEGVAADQPGVLPGAWGIAEGFEGLQVVTN